MANRKIPRDTDVLERENALAVQFDAVFIGWQSTLTGEAIPLYNIVLKEHPAFGSTVTELTLRKWNLQVPHTPVIPRWVTGHGKKMSNE